MLFYKLFVPNQCISSRFKGFNGWIVNAQPHVGFVQPEGFVPVPSNTRRSWAAGSMTIREGWVIVFFWLSVCVCVGMQKITLVTNPFAANLVSRERRKKSDTCTTRPTIEPQWNWVTLIPSPFNPQAHSCLQASFQLRNKVWGTEKDTLNFAALSGLWFDVPY